MRITAKPVDLTSVLGDPLVLAKLKNRIYRIGIELEGGWTKLAPGMALTHDGSVVFNNPPRTGRCLELYNIINYGGPEWYGAGPVRRQELEVEFLNLDTKRRKDLPAHIGEFPSTAMEITHWAQWIRQSYPTHVNDTCGMHVHLSFRSNLNYQRLMEPEYTATVVSQFCKWAERYPLLFPPDHSIWKRLSGQNEYCQYLHHADGQVKQTKKIYDHHTGQHRYTAINYCFAMHETLECRLLPMMPDAEVAIDAIQHFLNTTNAFLRSVVRKESSLPTTVVADDVVFRDVINVTV